MVYILMADGFEEIEALTVVDVLRRAEIKIEMVSIGGELVTGAHGIVVKADKLIGAINVDNAEMIILPGGMPGTKNLEASEDVQSLVKDAVDAKKWVSAICAAPMILGNKGYLKNIEAICFPGFEKYLSGAIIKDRTVNVYKKFITSKGAGTSLDFAFAIVSVLRDEATARDLMVRMQYNKRA